MITNRSTRAIRTVQCGPCGGSGVELGTRNGQIVTQHCFWCDGKGEIEQSIQPDVCHQCGQVCTLIEEDRMYLCADCTAWEPADPAFVD